MHDTMNEMERIEISKVVQKELEKNPKIRVLLHIQDKGQMSVWQLAKELDWQPSKAHAVVRQLEKSHSIKTERKIINGRAVKLIKLAGD